jgi:tetratricopeptide (TPR) repeat protein
MAKQSTDQNYKETPFISYEDYLNREKRHFQEKIEKQQRRLKNALKTLEEKKILNQKNFEEKLHSFSPDDFIEMSQKKNLQNIIEISKETMISSYEHGMELFNRNAFKKSAEIFFFLTQLNQNISSFWIALALSEEKQGNSEAALDSFINAFNLDKENTAIAINVSDCLIKLDRENDSKIFLDEILEFYSNNKDFNISNEMKESLKMKRNLTP